MKLVNAGVYSYFGFGLRDKSVAVIAAAVVKKLVRLYPKHPLASSGRATAAVRDALEGISQWPVFVDDEGKPLFERSIHR